MYESSVIQHFIEQGIQQGERKGILESLISILEFHFSPDEVYPLKPILESIEELQQLKQLQHLALQVSNLEEFKHFLSSIRNDI